MSALQSFRVWEHLDFQIGMSSSCSYLVGGVLWWGAPTLSNSQTMGLVCNKSSFYPAERLLHWTFLNKMQTEGGKKPPGNGPASCTHHDSRWPSCCSPSQDHHTAQSQPLSLSWLQWLLSSITITCSALRHALWNVSTNKLIIVINQSSINPSGLDVLPRPKLDVFL